MKLLLDTHTFIWWDSDPDKLSQYALDLIQDHSNTLLLSVASIWEMQIKIQLGKLTLVSPLSLLIADQQLSNNLELLSVTSEHVLGLDSLPNHHKDPFDRILIAQANIENAVLISCDQIIAQYPVKLAW